MEIINRAVIRRSLRRPGVSGCGHEHRWVECIVTRFAVGGLLGMENDCWEWNGVVWDRSRSELNRSCNLLSMPKFRRATRGEAYTAVTEMTPEDRKCTCGWQASGQGKTRSR